MSYWKEGVIKMFEIQLIVLILLQYESIACILRNRNFAEFLLSSRYRY